MHRLITILLIMLYWNLFAQRTQSTEEIDRISYEQFHNKQFKELKGTVKNAIEDSIDFYYLRLRAGISGYDKKNYEYAISHFEKALAFFPNDTLSKEYLYYCYLFSARTEMANDFASKQDIYFQQKIGYKSNPFDFIGISGGAILTNNISANKGKTFKSDAQPGKAERSLNGNLYFGGISFQNTIKRRLHINNSILFYNSTSRYEFELIKPTSEKISSAHEFKNLNFQYNFGLSYITKREWTIALGLGYYRIKSNTFSAGQPDLINNTVPVTIDTTATNSFSGSVSVSKRIKHIQPFIQISASNLNALLQIQAEAGLTYFPLGNYNFYGTTSVAFLRNGISNQYVIKQQIGFKILKWWWSEVNFNYGNLSNYIANNGLTTYNTSDAIKLQTGLDFNLYIKKHFQINIGYTFQQREKTTSLFNRNDNSTIYQNSNYLTHLIKTALIWKF